MPPPPSIVFRTRSSSMRQAPYSHVQASVVLLRQGEASVLHDERPVTPVLVDDVLLGHTLRAKVFWRSCPRCTCRRADSRPPSATRRAWRRTRAAAAPGWSRAAPRRARTPSLRPRSRRSRRRADARPRAIRRCSAAPALGKRESHAAADGGGLGIHPASVADDVRHRRCRRRSQHGALLVGQRGQRVAVGDDDERARPERHVGGHRAAGAWN